MRQSLSRTFNQIYILDLHGSTKPKEMIPAGLENENVFDIQKGVAIALFVKKKGLDGEIWHGDVWGSRLAKYQAVARESLTTLEWARPRMFPPYYMMAPIDWTGWEQYGQWWQLSDTFAAPKSRRQIFNVNVLGFQTHRDDFAVAYERNILEQRIENLANEAKADEALADLYYPPTANTNGPQI